GTYAATPIGNSRIPIMDCPSHPPSDEHYAGGTNMEDLSRGNYAACYGAGGYGSATYTKNPMIGGVFGNNSKYSLADLTDGSSNTLSFSELRYRLPDGNTSTADIRGLWAYGSMGANIFSTFTGPNSSAPDQIWGCRDQTPGLPCGSSTQGPINGINYQNLYAAARSYHIGGVHTGLADGSVRFVSENISLTIWQALGTRGGSEAVGNF
ncbi:MAG TPA: DUF1559 domain-containing protein, partial [Planctomycetaceae bacterium]|nr:DUF1559 domain-containing protein [Planctomycetaceae bacterium]